MKLKAIKQRSSGRDVVGRWEFRQRKNVEAVVKLYLRTSQDSPEWQEKSLREALGNDFADYVEVTP